MKLHAYTVFAGRPEEGAVLVFAHSVQEARKIGYKSVIVENCESYIREV